MKVFLTGGTGTLGQELIKRFYKKWDITIFSRDELKQAKLTKIYPKINCRIGDVRDYQRVFTAMKGANCVIHAAAMKRIEICEENPMEAINTNVFGTENVARAAYHHGIKKAITIGSDKGVEPINVYGMTKALQEKIFINYDYNCVRYGNVFGSRGSVVTLFKEQTSRGEHLTVTDPNMTRFIITIDQAINLLTLSLKNPMKGDIFIRKSPAAKLIDIARAFSNKFRVVGKFTGEKLHEILIHPEEFTRLRKRGEDYAVIGKKTIKTQYEAPYSSDKERLLTVSEIKKLISTCLPY